MNLCRACLSSDKELFPTDDNFISSYSLLTNIYIKCTDGKPQHVCRTCMEAVNFFIEFRNKCVFAETALLDILKQCPQVKSEAVVKIETLNVKVEVKDENEDCGSEMFFEDAQHDYSEDDSSIIKKEESLDVKKKKPRRQTTRKKKESPKEKNNETITSKGNYVQLTNEKPICGLCAEVFEDRASLNKHLEGHHSDQKCQLCSGSKFESWPQLLAHRILHTVHHQKCHLCNVKFRSHNNLEFHYRKMHSGEKNILLTCHLCPRKFNTPKKLSKHIWGLHSKNQYICDICSKTYNNKQSLKSHIVAHGNVKPYVCDLCGYRSKFAGGLAAHKIRRHEPQKCICKSCGAAYADRERLARHTCGDRSRVCPVCGKSMRHGFTRHLATHTEERRYKCDRCPTSYKSRTALKVHKDKHDGNPTQQCEYCLARFYNPSVLTKHRRIHTGEKPYACKKCEMRFTGRHNLKVHMKVHGEMLVVKRNQEPV